MGSSRSWAADMEDEIKVCRHGNETKYFDTCMCDGCITDRALAKYRSEMIEKLVYHYRSGLNILNTDQLERMSEKIR